MASLPWKKLLFAGAVSSGIASFFGPVVQTAVLLLVSCLSPVAIVVGLKVYKPKEKSPWILLAAAVALIFWGAALRAVIPLVGSAQIYWCDAVSMAGYCFLILSFNRLGRLRANDQDPTNVADALTLSLGVGVLMWAVFLVPFLTGASLGAPERFAGVSFFVLDVALFFVICRLAIGPGAQTGSYKLMAATVGLALFSDLMYDTTLAALNVPGAGLLTLLAATLAFTACAAASWHPGMRQITKAGAVDIAQLSARRLATMGLALVVPPGAVMARVLYTGDTAYLGWLLAACLLITGLTVFRFAGIAFARERMADNERTLSRAVAGLVSATDRTEMYTAALHSVQELVASPVNRPVVKILLKHEGAWFVASASGTHDPEVALPLTVALNELEDSNVRTGTWIDHETFTVAMYSRNQLRGALLLTGGGQLSNSLRRALERLASDLALALESASLSEDLFRQRSERRFKALVDQSADVIFVVDRAQAVTFSSPSAERLFGSRSGNFQVIMNTLDASDRLPFLSMIDGATGRPTEPIELCFLGASGERRWFEVSATDLSDDREVAGVVVNAHEITERKRLEDDLRYKVLHDDLTGLANRTLFADRVGQALLMRSGDQVENAVIHADLDDFRTVNESHGQSIGDQVLKIMALRLANFVRPGDTPARLGGDEFAVLVSGCSSPEEVHEVALRLSKVLSEPIIFDGKVVALEASFGIAFADGTTDAEVLLRNAEAAKHQAKYGGKHRIEAFDESQFARLMDQIALRSGLPSALENSEMHLVYQPLINFGSEQVVGFEALLRWTHPTRGFVSPVDFIPIAEYTGLIVPIGAWVLEEACRQLASWNQITGDTSLKMSINVSPVQLADPLFVQCVKDTLDNSGVSSSQIALEFTETSAIEDSLVRERVQALHSLGVGIAADDFGSGFASYAALQQLPFTTVKIDRSLIMNIPDETRRAEAQVRSIIEMAHETGLVVVAEGIETEEQHEVLKGMGCDVGQGYFYDRPLAPSSAEKLVKRQGLLPLGPQRF